MVAVGPFRFRFLPIERPCRSAGPFFQRVAAPVGLLGFVSDDMGVRRLGDFARKMRFVASPIAESRTETVNRHRLLIHPVQKHFHRHDGKRLTGALAQKDKFARPRFENLPPIAFANS